MGLPGLSPDLFKSEGTCLSLQGLIAEVIIYDEKAFPIYKFIRASTWEFPTSKTMGNSNFCL